MSNDCNTITLHNPSRESVVEYLEKVSYAFTLLSPRSIILPLDLERLTRNLSHNGALPKRIRLFHYPVNNDCHLYLEWSN